MFGVNRQTDIGAKENENFSFSTLRLINVSDQSEGLKHNGLTTSNFKVGRNSAFRVPSDLQISS